MKNWRNWPRRWWSERRATRPAPSRTALILSATTVTTTVALWLAKELLFDQAKDALVGGPIWLRIPIYLLLLVGGVTIVVSAGRGSRGSRPPPDDHLDAAGSSVLPPAPPMFVGRGEDLARVAELTGTGQVVAVTGRRGVGTSALTLHAAHRVVHRLPDSFPDGQVYLDLRGAASHPPVSAAGALRRVLRRFGLAEPRSNRPGDLDTGAERLRSWLAARRALLVLDNVDHAEQVRRLLPAGPGCRILLSGSVDLARLPGTHVHNLGELSEDEAVELLTAVGDPELVAQDRPAAVDLVNKCGRQPLAVRLLGQLLRDRGWPPRRVVEAVEKSLADSPYRLHGPHGQDSDYAAALRPLWDACDVTYRELSAAHRQLFRLLVLVPTTEIGTHAAAAVAALPVNRTTQLLDELARRGLVESARPGRYRIRQLLATSAYFHLNQESSAVQLDRARLRLARYFALMAEEYAEPLLPASRPDGDQEDQEREQAVAEALAWFRHEHELLLQLVTGPYMVALGRNRKGAGRRVALTQGWLWRLAVGLCTWYAAEGRLDDWQEVCEAVLRMPLVRTNPAAALWAHNQLGVVRRRGGEPSAAWQELDAASRLTGGRRRRGRAQVQTNLGMALLDQGQLRSALRHLEAGSELRSRTDRHGQAVSALGLGAAYLRVGELGAARRRLSHAVNAFDALHDQRGLAAALNAIGVVLWEQNDRLGAKEHWDLAHRLYLTLGDDPGQACLLLNIAAGLLRPGGDRIPGEDQAAEARDLLMESLRLRAGQPETRGTGLSHLYLGDALALSGDAERASHHWREAGRVLTPLGGAEAAEAARRPAAGLA